MHPSSEGLSNPPLIHPKQLRRTAIGHNCKRLATTRSL